MLVGLEIQAPLRVYFSGEESIVLDLAVNIKCLFAPSPGNFYGRDMASSGHSNFYKQNQFHEIGDPQMPTNGLSAAYSLIGFNPIFYGKNITTQHACNQTFQLPCQILTL